MPRFCTRCGYPLDAEHHDLLRDDETGEPIKRVKLARRGRGRFGIQRVFVYGCRVRPLADSPTTGKHLVPRSMQREKVMGLPRYVHVNRFKADLKP
jgi:hypothetical protein